MEKEKIEIVLADILDELKTASNAMQEQKQQIIQLQEKFLAFEEKTNRLNEGTMPAIDIDSVEDVINTASNEM